MKTGLFVSPHISSFRERIQINNQLISPEDFVVSVPHSSPSLTDRQRHLERILLLCESHSIPATQFEITFLMSCLQYESAQCDVVVLEVSLSVFPLFLPLLSPLSVRRLAL
jgi:dihydrofolate synthase / folylpolyglutamate synthase